MTYVTHPHDRFGKTAPEDWSVDVVSRVPAEGSAELLTFKFRYRGGQEERLENVPFERGYQVEHLKLWLANRDDEVAISDVKMSIQDLAQCIGSRYGTLENPVSIMQAREAIRADFLKFWQLVTDLVQMPNGHRVRNGWGSTPEHELTWFRRCEIESTHSGASLHAGLAVPDSLDTTQLCIEVRYFHPATHYIDGLKTQQVSRWYDAGYSAILWVKQGRNYAGMYRSLIKGNEFCPYVGSVDALALTVVQRLNTAIAMREPTHFDECENESTLVADAHAQQEQPQG